MKKKTSWCSCEDGENEISLGEMQYETKVQKNNKFGGSLRDSMMQERKMIEDDRAIDEK